MRAHDIAHYINASNHNQQQSRYNNSDEQQNEQLSGSPPRQQDQQPAVLASNSALASLDQQLRALRKELKTKDDKLARVTEHSMMMATHMDRLKGEVRAAEMCVATTLNRYNADLPRWRC